MPFVIYDKGDGTFHIGEGEWSVDGSFAKPYARKADAVAEIEAIDPDEVFRDRFVARPATGEMCSRRMLSVQREALSAMVRAARPFVTSIADIRKPIGVHLYEVTHEHLGELRLAHVRAAKILEGDDHE